MKIDEMKVVLEKEVVENEIKRVLETRYVPIYLKDDYKVIYDERVDTAYHCGEKKEIHIGWKAFANAILVAEDLGKIDLTKLVTTMLFHEIAHGIYTNDDYWSRGYNLGGYDVYEWLDADSPFDAINIVEDGRIEYYAGCWGIKGVDFSYTRIMLANYNPEKFKPTNFGEYINGLIFFNHITYKEDKKLIDKLITIYDTHTAVHNCYDKRLLSSEMKYKNRLLVSALDSWITKCLDTWKKYNAKCYETEIKRIEAKLIGYDLVSNPEGLDETLLKVCKTLQEVYVEDTKGDLCAENKKLKKIRHIRGVIRKLIEARDAEYEYLKSLETESETII